MASARNVEDIYPLTPMQQGMLFDALYAPESGVYVQQVKTQLRGRFDPPAFRAAWQALVDRHPALRTAFEWERRDDPFQVVYRQPALPWMERDLSDEAPEAQARTLDEYMAEDRRRGFRLDRPPLLRVALFRLAVDRWEIVWTHHHLILDGWSVPLILEDLLALLRVGGAPESRRPFREYVTWLRRQPREAAQAFWTEELAGFTPTLPLPARRASTSARTFIGALAHEAVRLDAASTATLTASGRAQALTLSTMLSGAWAVVLGMFTSATDVLFGSTVSGRPPGLPGSGRMIGLFINTLPVRVRLPPEVTVGSWLRALQDRLGRQRDFEYTPLVDALGAGGLDTQSASLESVLVFENYPAATEPAPGTSLDLVDADVYEQTSFPITLVAVPGHELLIKIDFDDGRFEPQLVRRLLSAMRDCLSVFTDSPETPLGRLRAELAANDPSLDRPEQRPWPDTALVHDLIDRAAARTPEAAAIVIGNEVVTFGELRRRSNAVRDGLRAFVDSCIGIAVPRSAELIVSILGVLKAGAAYVPLDVNLPDARAAAITADAGVALVIADSGREPTRYGTVPVVSVTELEQDTGALSSAQPDAASLAYVLYTSGSTGTPKGVMVTHRGLVNYVRWACEEYDAGGGSGAPLHSPLGFDLTITSLLPALVAGRAVQLIAEHDGLDGLVSALTSSPGFSLVKITPAHLDALSALLPEDEAAAATRAFVIGGDALTYDQLQPWRRHAPRTRLINEYGPTETVVGSAIYDAAADDVATGPVPIGRPIANTSLYVLDGACSPVPRGVIGELYVGGDGVARGYQGRPDLTAERFLPDPWSATPGARMYRTGDRARIRPDGELEFHGRTDDQIKIRGYRIEPGEIESALRAHDRVTDAVVVATLPRERRATEARLAAFVVLRAGTTDGLETWLRSRLPAHMIPTTVHAIDQVPLTRNGKVDRGALAARFAAAGSPAECHEAPRGAREELVALLWADVLGCERVGRNHSFFELGGHSLVATRLIVKVRRAFGREVPMRAVFDYPTVAAFARCLGTAGGSDGISIQPRPSGTAPVLSFAQQRLWFLHELDPTSTAYHVPAAIAVEGPLDLDCLAGALQRVVDRHESLRTGIRSVAGGPVVTVVAARLPWDVIDLCDIPAAEHEARVSDIVARETGRLFDLAAPPLLRAAVVRLGAARHVLIITAHHLVLDAWSMDVLVREAAAAYEALERGAEPSFAALPVQYADVARWQRQQLEDRSGDALLDYWTRQLEGVEALELPTDREPGAAATLAGRTLDVELDTAAVTQLLALARRAHATPFMAFLAVFEVLLARYSGQDDFVVGTPVAGRDRAEIEPLIGLFLNTLALRSDVSKSVTFAEMLPRVRQTMIDALEHQDLPFERLVEALDPARDLERSPIVRVMFTVQHPAAPPRLAGRQVTSIPVPSTTAKFDLSLGITGSMSGWRASFEYRSDLFHESTIAQLAKHFTLLIAAAAAQPAVPVWSLPMLDPTDAAWLASWHAPAAVPWEDEAAVPGLFARQAARTPSGIAVIFEGQTLTYQELRTRAVRLAHRLRRQGVGPDVLVGLCLDRSIDLIVALLAVFEAGGAYLPLDPSYPAERIALMLRDAGNPLVLVQERTAARLPAVARFERLDVPQDDGHDADIGTALPVPPLGALAYVIYTSGSTGRPKGVMISHRALANHTRWMQRVYPLSPGDCVLQKTAASFDASVWEFVAPLIAGATLAIARPGGHQDPAYLVETIRAERVTTLQVVPSLLRLLLAEPEFAQCTSLRRVFAGGEPLTGTLARDFFAVSEAALVNLYGPTECTVDSVTFTCDRHEHSDRVSIGLPIDNTTAYVLDHRLTPVPAGVVGELYVGGAAVGRGYVGQPALTAERFLPDPMIASAGAVMYRTGDLVRQRRSGDIEYVGRADNQIKLHGYRIELGEIERAIEAFTAVQQAAVTVRETGARSQLAAYVVPRPGQTIDRSALRTFVRTRLPEHMTPTLIVEITAVPRLPNGKVDRRSLPEPPDRTPDALFVAPGNPVEETLAALWAAVLGVPSVGIRDNFFALGGDSILSLQVVARARALGLSITPAQMFLHQTVESLAAVTVVAAAAEPNGRDEHRGPIPLTPIQRWFFSLALPRPAHWNQALLLTTPPSLDPAVTQAALADVVARHDAFRLRFVHGAAGWRQERFSASVPALEIVDLSGSGDPAVDLEAGVRDAQASLDLGAPPLLRAVWFDFGRERRGRLLLTAHHLVVDGVSWRVLLEDLQLAYSARLGSAAPDFPAASESFAGWARHVASIEAADAKELEFWRQQQDPGARPLPRDLAADDRANIEATARTLDVSLTEAETSRLLHDVPAAYRTHTVEVLLAALTRALGAWLGERAIVVELEGHGRDASGIDVSRTVGWFTTLFPLRLQARRAGDPGDWLKTVKEQLRSVPRRGLGYGAAAWGDPAPLASTHVAPAISFNYLGHWGGPSPDDAAEGLPGSFGRAPEDAVAMRSPEGRRTHEVEIVAWISGGTLHVRWTYSEALHNRDTMAVLAGEYRRALITLIEHCTRIGHGGYTPSDFSATGLDQAQLDKLLSKLRDS